MGGIDASVDFLVIWGWRSCQNWMLGCAGTIQKTIVFVIFHFFNICMILVSPGGVLGFHFGGLGITWDTILVILEGPGEVLKFQWILGSPREHPKLKQRGKLRVKFSSGAPIPTNPRLPICYLQLKDLQERIPETLSLIHISEPTRPY